MEGSPNNVAYMYFPNNGCGCVARSPWACCKGRVHNTNLTLPHLSDDLILAELN